MAFFALLLEEHIFYLLFYQWHPKYYMLTPIIEEGIYLFRKLFFICMYTYTHRHMFVIYLQLTDEDCHTYYWSNMWFLLDKFFKITKTWMRNQAHSVYNPWKHICLKNMCNRFVSSLVCHGTAAEVRFFLLNALQRFRIGLLLTISFQIK